jgi:AbrB family looped-hinge helix DNA binding protein
LSPIKVKRKGEVTIPVDLREKFNLHEGSVLKVEERDNATLLKPAPPLKAGKIVGEDEYKQIRQS